MLCKQNQQFIHRKSVTGRGGGGVIIYSRSEFRLKSIEVQQKFVGQNIDQHPRIITLIALLLKSRDLFQR